MPINPNTFGAPPAPTAPPPYSRPPGPPAPLPPPLSDASQGRKRWPGILAGAAAGALVATLTAAMITTQARDSGNAATTASTTTRTVAAPTPAAPAPLPVAQADQQTCHGGWVDAGHLMDSAEAASAPLKGMKISDPGVQAKPELAASVQKIGGLLGEAAAALERQIAPGSTPILESSARTAVETLNGESASYKAYDAIGAATFNRITNAVVAQMYGLCHRLAPL